jgi:hypothetical protein
MFFLYFFIQPDHLYHYICTSLDGTIFYIFFFIQLCKKVERGLYELRKLGIESQLWEVTRRASDDDFSNRRSPTGSAV